MGKRAVFVDKRDMPKKLYPHQFKVKGSLTRASDAGIVPMDVFVELTKAEITLANAEARYVSLLLASTRSDVLNEITAHLKYTKEMEEKSGAIIRQLTK
jgi:hypothetical protein